MVSMPKDSNSHKPAGARAARFATTRWSLVVTAGDRSSANSRRALESLCAAYWHPLYAYVRRRVSDVNEAQDLTQAFFAELLEKNYVGSATPQRGRFRAFLLTALKHFLSKQWDKAKAQKRGGGRAPIRLDFASDDSRCSIETASGLTPEEIFDRRWAETLLDQVMARLEREFADAGKQSQFSQLKPLIIGQHEGATYADAGEMLGTTEAAAKMAVHRMRRRYRRLLREEVAQTVADPGDIDDEIRDLFAAFSRFNLKKTRYPARFFRQR
jgi:DNA-directed RNA polymerase specialized sigma24 family protein